MEIETTSRPFQEYRTEEYAKLGLPKAPAIMVNDELIVQGCDINEVKVGVGHLPPSWVARTGTGKEGDSGTLVQIKDRGSHGTSGRGAKTRFGCHG